MRGDLLNGPATNFFEQPVSDSSTEDSLTHEKYTGQNNFVYTRRYGQLPAIFSDTLRIVQVLPILFQ
jgi:hypothetical protein